MRWRIPKYFPGWLVSGGGGSGGSGTVQTDGVTIQGDGSAGNKIAIKAVQTDATLTGAGTVASPLSAAQQTPTGWPLTFYTYGQQVGAGGVAFSNTADKLNVWGLEIVAQVLFSNISILIDTTDAVNNYDFGFYDLAGTRRAHVGAQTLPASGIQSFAVVGAPITLNPGIYFFAGTCHVNTATFQCAGSASGPFYRNLNISYGTSTGGALPASITPPALAIANGFSPIFALS